MVNYRLPSFGLFTTQLNPVYWFGVPRNVEFSGLGMDVDHMASQLSAKNNSKGERVAFKRSMGLRSSAMEHQVPELMYSTDDAPVYGISAVKALAIAGQQGQKIWTIDSNNISMALADINLSDDIENEIRNAVNVGNIAIAHQGYLDFYGTRAAGYLLLDPETGAGAYKIASGGNGGVLIFAGLLIIMTMMFFLMPLLASGVGLTFFALGLLVGTSLVAAGVAALTGNSFACNVFLATAAATLATMIGLLIPASAKVAGILWSIFGIGGSAGSALLGLLNLCG